MQIKEARGIYQSQIKSYSKTASELRQKQKRTGREDQRNTKRKSSL